MHRFGSCSRPVQEEGRRHAEKDETKPQGQEMFIKSKDCCICYSDSAETICTKLPCGHLMCTECLKRITNDHCPHMCAGGAFDRALILQGLGISMPKPVSSQKRQVGRAFVACDDFVPACQGTVAAESPCGLISVWACENSWCGMHRQEQRLDHGIGKHDLLADPIAQTFCRCEKEQTLRRLIFTNCHADIDLVEAFNNGRKKHLAKPINSKGKVTEFSTPGHYNKFIVTTSKAFIAKSAVRRCKPRALVLSVEKERPGAQEEQLLAKSFFEKCGFEVRVVKDPTLQEMFNEMQFLRNPQSQQQECCAVAVMAHGSESRITTSDGRQLPLNQLFGVLDGQHAPDMIGIKKYFFIQACRKDGEALTVDMTDADVDSTQIEFTRAANFHWCYATIPGQFAYRGRMFKTLGEVVRENPGRSMEDLCRVANKKMVEDGLLMIVNHTLLI